jgi:AcrR family transcriptional regulator
MASTPTTPTRRVPAAERRDALIDAAIHEFAHGGLHGTPVGAIARSVGVAQPYVFSLFPTKLGLFLAAVDRSFTIVSKTFERAAQRYAADDLAPECEDALQAMGTAYVQLLEEDRDVLMLQHQAYAACGEEAVRVRVRALFAALVNRVSELSGAEAERIDEFIRYGLWLNVAAAMGVGDLSAGCEWVRDEMAP